MVGFYGISNIVGYSILNPVYIYIYIYIYMYIYKFYKHFVDNIYKKHELSFWLSLNHFKYCCVTVTIEHLSFVCTQFVDNFIFNIIRSNLFAY